jgi:hypothetical protein
MNQDKWSAIRDDDPRLLPFTENAVVRFFRAHAGKPVTEIFLSGVDGTKVAFLHKPTNWNHRGKPKHDAPMMAKVWIGRVELDESSGMQQVQFSIPVMENGKAIGSLVVGLNPAKL